MSDRDLQFVNLFCRTDTFLFVIETPMRKCKHPFSAPAKCGTLKLKYITEHRNKFTSTLPKYQRLFVFN